MAEYFATLGATLALYLPTLLAALAVLIIGWLIALAVSAVVRNVLNRVTLDDRIASMVSGQPGAPATRINTESIISKIVFWVIMLFVIVLFLQTLRLTAVSGPLNELLAQILTFIPKLLSAAILLFIAWLVATALKMLITRVLSNSEISRRLSTDAQVSTPNRVSLGQTLGNVVYWLVFLLFLPAVLDALDLQGILAPVQRVVDEILGVLPNILGAVVIFALGYLVARIVRQIVTNLLAGLGIDRLGSETGAQAAMGQTRLSDIIGTIVYVLILIPVAIAALNTLNIPAISGPATNMLDTLLNALPAIFGAFLLLAISYFIARLLGNFVAGILGRVGFDRIFESIGLFRGGAAVSFPPVSEIETPPGAETGAATTRLTPSTIVGYLVTVAILLFAVMEAADMLGFEILATIVSQFIVAATQVLVGLVIFGIGLYLASLADRLVRSSGMAQANILAPAARAAIIVFSGALALRQMGIAESIVNLAFGLLLGAVAVAAALAFGLGGRDVAARQLERWQQQIRAQSSGPGSVVRSQIPPTGELPRQTPPPAPDELIR